jgi:hypothetical protein
MAHRSIQKVRFEKNLTVLFLLAMCLSGCGGNSLPGAATPGATKILRSLSISPANPVLTLGSSQQFTVTGSFSDGSRQDMTQKVSWNSTQPAIAAINSSGMAVSKQSGTTMVSAASGAVSSSTNLTVSPAALLSIAIAPPNPTVSKGIAQPFVATGSYSDGSTQDLTSAVAWTVSPPGVAAISSTGLARAQGIGTAIVKAISGSISGTDTLTVTPPVLVSIAVTPSNPSVPMGLTQQFVATGTLSDLSTQDLTGSAIWTTGASDVATISGTGLATAQSMGLATITAASTAASGSITGTDVLTVSAPLFAPTEQKSHLSPLSNTELSTLQGDCAFIQEVGGSQGICTCGFGDATSGPISGSGTPVATPLAAVDYFSNANTVGAPDATVNVANPGLTDGDLCAMIYVFDSREEMNECCGCPVSKNGLRILSVNNDLTSNTLTQVRPHAGVVWIVSGDQASNPICNAGAITLKGMLTSWFTHIQSTRQAAGY